MQKNESINNPAIEVGKIARHIVSMEQAKKIALLQVIYPDIIKKPSKIMNIGVNPSHNMETPKINPAKNIKSIFPYRKGETNPTFYIINFETGGFTIVAGDDRVSPILAFSDNTFFPTDREYPYGLARWIDATHEGIKKVRVNNEAQSDDVKTE